ncbi:helix-turn-helix transcriptional regulator [Paenibacillus lautus]|uniref:helix-turn-helix domain-containing protein n=1 Tax=Paenibacillus lautus TaxID=1401 RepID=UPI003D2BA7F8
MDNLFKNVGNKIRDIRKSKGLSQEQLAEMVGTKHTDIGKLERGERNVTLKTLDKISNTLEIEMYQLFQYEIESKFSRKEFLKNEISNIVAELSESDLEKIISILNIVYKKH